LTDSGPLQKRMLASSIGGPVKRGHHLVAKETHYPAVGGVANHLYRAPVSLDTCKVTLRWCCDAGEVAVVVEVRELDVAADRVFGRAPRKRLVVLAVAFGNRIEPRDDFLGESLGRSAFRGGYLLRRSVAGESLSFGESRQPASCSHRRSS
jgi:hypothetical protein